MVLLLTCMDFTTMQYNGKLLTCMGFFSGESGTQNTSNNLSFLIGIGKDK